MCSTMAKVVITFAQLEKRFGPLDPASAMYKLDILAAVGSLRLEKEKEKEQEKAGPKKRRRANGSEPCARKPCNICGKELPATNIADHAKEHILEASGSVVPDDRRCDHCAGIRPDDGDAQSKDCTVGVPADGDINTVRCLACIKGKMGCSFRRVYPGPVQGMTVHPALV